MGFSKDAPPSSFIGESTPGHRSRARSIQVPFGRRAPTLLHVPSSRFLTVSTGSSSLRQRSDSYEPSRPPRRCCVHVSARFRPWGPPRFRGTLPLAALSSVRRDSSTSPRCIPALRSFFPEHSCGVRPRPSRRHHLVTAGRHHHPRQSPDCDLHRLMYTAFLALSPLPAFRT